MSYATKLEQLINQHRLAGGGAGDIGDEWQTPELEWLGINALFGPFSVDLFATEQNAKCKHFFTIDDNALDQDWGLYCRNHNLDPACFANPPHSRSQRNEQGVVTSGLQHCMHKAFFAMKFGVYSVWLVPAAVDADWFPWETASQILFISEGRISFDAPWWYRQDPHKTKPSSARAGMCLVFFDPNHKGPRLVDRLGRSELRMAGNKVLKDCGQSGETGVISRDVDKCQGA